MNPRVSELNNAAPIPGRDPLSMLKNNEPIPASGLYLNVNADSDGKAAKIIICKGGMHWKKMRGEVHIDFNQAGEKDPSSVRVLYTSTDYPQKEKKPYDRSGAGYEGQNMSIFDSETVSTGDVLVTRDPINMTNHSLTLIVPLDLTDAKDVKEIIRIFELDDSSGAINAAKMSMELIGLPIADSAKITELLRKKLDSS